MDYTAMMQSSMPQMGLSYGTMPRPDDMHRPRHHPYTFPYNSDAMFLMSQLPPHPLDDPHALAQAAKPAEPKPRLGKDEVQLLENEFQKNPKPSSQRKREIAELLKVDNPRINNWFQNRRAKAKQMLRREAEPQAAGEQSPSASPPSEHHEESVVSEYYGVHNQSMPLRASSASFPSKAEPESSMTIYPPSSVAGNTDANNINAATVASANDYPSPKSLGLPNAADIDLTYSASTMNFLPQAAAGSYSAHASPHHQSSHSNTDPIVAAATAPTFEQPSLNAYVPFTTAMGMDQPVMAYVNTSEADLLNLDSSVPQPLDKDLMNVQALDQTGFPQQVSSPGSAHSPGSAMSDVRFRSPPPPSNIAMRRNKGTPATLAPTAFRNGTFGPKTGMDIGVPKRIEGPTPIRRIASSSGLVSNRIQKPVGTPVPRSPLYLERNKALLHSLQTVTTAAASGPATLVRSLSNNVSPVTPSDMLSASTQAGGVGANAGVSAVGDSLSDSMTMTASSSPSGELQHPHASAYGAPAPPYPFFAAEGATLRTPPRTPGFNGMVPAPAPDYRPVENTWTTLMPHDDALLTPSLGSYGSDEFPVLHAAPNYIMHSQPPTPSVTQALPCQGYFPMTQQGQPEYAFPGEAYGMFPGSTGKASPGLFKSKQFQFTQNVTPQDFSVDK